MFMSLLVGAETPGNFGNFIQIIDFKCQYLWKAQYQEENVV